MAVGLFGLVSILTFSAIACERCLAIACPLQGAAIEGRLRVTRTHAKRVSSMCRSFNLSFIQKFPAKLVSFQIARL